MSTRLPAFAKAWMAQWEAAAPALQKIRDQELRAMSVEEQARAAEVMDLPKGSLRPGDRESYSGLVEQQAWFMRFRLLQAARP